jgi:recombination protein RecR
LYHVLGGAISPLDGIGPSELSFDKLLNRIDDKLEEVIIATNPSTSGNATAMYVEKILKDKKVTISRLAVGLPVGSNLEYIDDKTVTTAIEGRVKLN